MSSPHVIVSAVHEPEESLKDWWENNRDSLDGFEYEYDHNDEIDWDYCEGVFKSSCFKEEFPVKTEYHSSRGELVIEIVLSNEYNMQDIQMTGLEEIIDEINFRMDSDFTLEVYYWYDGVDKPGGK